MRKNYYIMQRAAVIFLLTLLITYTADGQMPGEKGILILMTDTATGKYGYRNEAGKIEIPFGKYSYCFTDTFRKYAIVLDSGRGFVAIDRQFRVLYDVFIFDNGPDYPSDGLFRIKSDSKIGYADENNGKIAVKPQFACGYPFENGVAKVALHCETKKSGEHSTWVSDEWFYINKTGARVDPSTKR
jgi:hypothetical protein